MTFSQPGTYAYHCSIHPFIRGTVVVPNSPIPIDLQVECCATWRSDANRLRYLRRTTAPARRPHAGLGCVWPTGACVAVGWPAVAARRRHWCTPEDLPAGSTVCA